MTHFLDMKQFIKFYFSYIFVKKLEHFHIYAGEITFFIIVEINIFLRSILN